VPLLVKISSQSLVSLYAGLAGRRQHFKQRRLKERLATIRYTATRTILSVNIRPACFFLLTILLVTPVWSRSHKPEIPTDAGYIFALAAANHFMHAWQTGDLENGMVLLSDGLRHSQSADQMEDFFSNAGVLVRSFEITTGHGHPGHYTFPIVLVTPRGSHIARKFSEITLIEAGKNDWVVDKLP
jgi:hypothetical protein